MDLKKEFQVISLIYIFIVAAFANLDETISSSHLIPCEEGSYFFGEKCYKMFGEKNGLTWPQASDFCKTRNGSLVSIHTKEENDFLTEFFILGSRLDVWIGLHDRHREGVFMWDDGSVVNYANWEPTKPYSLFDNDDCVLMRMKSRGMWTDKRCDISMPFICQSTKSEKDSSHDSRFCTIEKGGGFKYFNSCYHIVQEEKSWDDAEEYCQESFKGHLLTILGPKPELFLNYLLPDFTEAFWIGLKIENSTQLKWSSGWQTVYNNWSNDHKRLQNGTCAVISKQIRWSSALCPEIRPFICEVSSDQPFVVKNAVEGWRCPDESKDWIDLDGDKCYTFENNPVTWYQANYACLEKGGTLAVIESEEENDALEYYANEMLSFSMPGVMFIGLHRSYVNDDVFEWIDGTPLNYENWSPQNPSFKSEGCGEIFRNLFMEWNDVPCCVERAYICSAKKVPPTVILEKEPDVEDFSCRKHFNCSVPPTIIKENLTDVEDLAYRDEFNCSGHIAVSMVLVGIIILLVTLLVILNFKTYCAKSEKQFPVKDINGSASFQNIEDSSQLITNPGNSECRF